MSEKGSPTRANYDLADEEDLNSSLITKVRSRVSEILPNSISRWFSPAAARNGKNGSLRRRRDSEDDGNNESMDDANNMSQEKAPPAEAPPLKRKKQEMLNSSLSERPGPSGLNTLLTSNDQRRRQSMPMGTKDKFSSSTPMSSPLLLSQGQKAAIQTTNKSASPYAFTTTSVKQKDPGNVIDVISSGGSGTSRKQLNIPPMSMDRSISEPPFSPFGTKNRKTLFGTSLMDQKFSSTLRPESSENILEEEDDDDEIDADDDKNNDDTLPVNISYTNGNGNESVSETSSIAGNDLSCSDSHRLSGFMGNSRLKKYRGGSTGDLCFSSHLQTEKSLFSERNTLMSQMNRPTFNASLYGSTSSLASSNSRLFANSPFYSGRTMYGGASAYSSKSDLKKIMRVPIQIRPSSSLSTLSSSNNSVASEPVALSNTAKRIMDIMNSFTSPLSEARKLGGSLNDNVLKLPNLVHTRKRFDEDDLKLSRSIRMQMPRTPYSRPSSSQSLNQPITNELQVPTISTLLQMKKRLQNNTESIRTVASVSASTVNTDASYKLPNQTDDSNNNVKQTNKMKNKINRVRESSASVQQQNQESESVPQVQLPDVQLPGLKSVPTFDIQIPATKTTTTIDKPKQQKSTEMESVVVVPKPKIDDKFKFSVPIRLDVNAMNVDVEVAENFMFSEPDPLVSDKNASKLNKSALNSSSKLEFNPDMAKPKATVEDKSTHNSIIASKSSALKTTGSCLDALKTGSCLDVLKPSQTSTVSVSTSATSFDSFGSQYKRTADKWECDVCMIRNDNEKQKCVACGNEKPGSVVESNVSKSSSSGFGDLFKMSSNQWECPTCMIRNDDSKTKCVSCETAKPGASKPVQPAMFNSKPMDSGFSSIVAKQSAQWECSACMTRNPSDKNKCMACEGPKPGATAAAPASDDGFKSLVAKQSSNSWECSACMTRNDSNLSKCVCCEQPNPKAVPETSSFKFSSADSSKFSFGMPKSDPNAPKFSFGVPSTASSTSTSSLPTTTSSSTGFAFGASATSAASTPATEIKFGMPAVSTVSATSTTPSTGFVFGSKATTATTSTTAAKPTFSFGVPAAADKTSTSDKPPVLAAATTSTFTFGTKASTDTVDTPKATPVETPKPEEPKKQVSFAATTPSTTGGFSFGTPKAAEEPKKTVESSPSAFAATKPSFGGFSFTSTAKPEEKKADATSVPKPEENKAPIFGASPKLAAAATPASNLFSFGTPKAATTTEPPKAAGGFSFTATTTTSEPKKPEAPVFGSTTPVFGAKAKTDTPSLTPTFSFGAAAKTAVSNTATVTPSFSFGGAAKPLATADAPKSTSFTFGASSQNTQPQAVTETKPSIFGSSTFGASSVPTTAPPAFGSSSSTFTFGGAAAAKTDSASTSTPFAFGGASSAATSTPAAPAFGQSSTFGSSTAAAQPASGGLPSFGSFSSGTTATPAFGQSSTFGSANAATSIFGASAPVPTFGNTATPAAASSSFSFNSSAGQPPSSDEPAAKRSSSGFNFGGAASSTTSAPFAFGAPSTDNNNSKPFAFSANAAPTFNFTTGVPSTGQSTAPNPSAFQFGAQPNTNLNPFAAPPAGQAQGAGTQQQQRRKIRAARRMGTGRPVV